MSYKQCSIADCDARIEGLGFCSKHYQRFKRHGDPLHTRPSPTQLFWQKVNIAGDDECWEWTQRSLNRGYGKMGWKIQDRWHCKLAHHIAWWLEYNKWPDDCLLHSCDNPLCCNPKHLREGTRAENVQDRDARHRTPKGDGHNSSILNTAQVLLIRKLRKQGVTGAILAKQFGVASTTIYNVAQGNTWKHIPNEYTR